MLDRIRGRRSRERRARLADAAAGVDRELAANLELAAMFGQTRQAVVFENAEFARHRLLLQAEVAAAYRALAEVYARLSDVESAMERRGPVNSIRPEDRALIESWEGDVREAQLGLRAAAGAEPRSGWSRLVVRLRGRVTTSR